MPVQNPKVDAVLKKDARWSAELQQLRAAILACGLDEELKWGQACYCLEGKNVVLIHGFKEYFAVLFMKGALLKDPKGILIQQTGNVQSARQLRFTSLAEAKKAAATVKAYVKEAIAVEKAGLKVPLKKTEDFPVPVELKRRFKELPGLQVDFEGLTPGRQRAYLLHFAQPKQSKTREARIDKAIPAIRAGKGLHD